MIARALLILLCVAGSAQGRIPDSSSEYRLVDAGLGCMIVSRAALAAESSAMDALAKILRDERINDE